MWSSVIGLTEAAVIVHAVHQGTLIKDIRLHSASIEHVVILVFFKDEGAFTEAFSELVEWIEKTTFKSHIKRVFSIRFFAEEIKVIMFLLM